MRAQSKENQVYELIRESLLTEKSVLGKKKHDLEDNIQRLKKRLQQNREVLIDTDKKRYREEDLTNSDTAKRRKLESGRNEVKSRMMGFLLNTLQKSKEELKGNENAMKKKEEIEKKVSEREQQEKREIAQKEILQIETQLEEKENQLKDIIPIYDIIEKALQKFWEQEHEMVYCNHIKTKTKPHLYFLPVKHNEQTSKLVEEQQYFAVSKRLEFEQFIRPNKTLFRTCIEALESLEMSK